MDGFRIIRSSVITITSTSSHQRKHAWKDRTIACCLLPSSGWIVCFTYSAVGKVNKSVEKSWSTVCVDIFLNTTSQCVMQERSKGIQGEWRRFHHSPYRCDRSSEWTDSVIFAARCWMMSSVCRLAFSIPINKTWQRLWHRRPNKHQKWKATSWIMTQC
jgi:hypothetical protein